jgi:hypothetical protein
VARNDEKQESARIETSFARLVIVRKREVYTFKYSSG